MEKYSESNSYILFQGNMLDMLEFIEPNSIDSIVTDPPYELNFMNKGWDNSGIAFQKETWKKCYEVLKAGGYLLAFGGTRTYHRIACAIEDAGFEIRDCIMWLYGSGFPKSMSISKGIEAKEKYGKSNTVVKRLVEQSCKGEEYKIKQTNNGAMGELIETTRKNYFPSTNLASKWQGWGTCLKPAYEPIIVARKPFKGSLVDNVIENGVGGINIDECRVGNEERTYKGMKSLGVMHDDNWQPKDVEAIVNGRFPANVILTYDETDFDEVCGGMPYTKSTPRTPTIGGTGGVGRSTNFQRGSETSPYNDSGSASRYFYCAKASKKDRDEGLDEFEKQTINDGRNKPIDNAFQRGKTQRHNVHPTVKPTELMQYLIRLVTHKNGIVLDPFMGSGSSGKAVMYENKERNANYKFIGIELTEEYLPIAEARINYANKQAIEENKERQLDLFEMEV